MTEPQKAPVVSTLLPPHVRQELVAAAQVQNDHTDRLRRQKAIEHATRRAKILCPHLFKHPEI